MENMRIIFIGKAYLELNLKDIEIFWAHKFAKMKEKVELNWWAIIEIEKMEIFENLSNILIK